jgi:hypothetical protein
MTLLSTRICTITTTERGMAGKPCPDEVLDRRRQVVVVDGPEVSRLGNSWQFGRVTGMQY